MTTKEWAALLQELRDDDRAAVMELCEAMIARQDGATLTVRQGEHLAHVDAGDWPDWACPMTASAGV
jgi:hypothetical protein